MVDTFMVENSNLQINQTSQSLDVFASAVVEGCRLR